MSSTPWSRLVPFLRPHLLALGAGVVAILATSGATLASVPLARFAGDTFAHLSLSKLNLLIAGLIVIYLAKGLFTWLAALAAAYVGLQTARDLRRALFHQLQAQGLAYFESRQAGDLASRVVADVGLVKDAMVVMVAELLPGILIVLVAVGYLLVLNWRLASVALLGMPIVGWAISLFAARLRAWSAATQNNVGEMLAYLSERLSNLMLVKSFAQEARELAAFDSVNRAHLGASMRGAQVQALQTPVVGTLQILAIGGVLWLGGWEILQSRLGVSDLLAFAAAVGVCIDPVLALSNAAGKIQAASGAMVRIMEVLEATPQIQEAAGAQELISFSGALRFDHVTFAYDRGADVLKGFDLEVAPGSVLALVGASGTGKTTVTKLVQRFYDPTGGRICFDGVDLRALKLTWLRRQVGYVSQDPALFSGSIADNIRYGRPQASEAEVEAAARAANAHGFIVDLPHGYATKVGERGATLSGGQRQRVAIARALLCDPRLLILDEATSALDVESEGLVQEALERLMTGRTTLIVAHRLSTVRRAERIVTLEAGRIVESGTHQELLARGGLYAQWHARQADAS